MELIRTGTETAELRRNKKSGLKLRIILSGNNGCWECCLMRSRKCASICLKFRKENGLNALGSYCFKRDT